MSDNVKHGDTHLNPRKEAEAGALQVWGQPKLHSEVLCFRKWHLWEGKPRASGSLLLTWDFHPGLNEPVFNFLETDKLAKLFWGV